MACSFHDLNHLKHGNDGYNRMFQQVFLLQDKLVQNFFSVSLRHDNIMRDIDYVYYYDKERQSLYTCKDESFKLKQLRGRTVLTTRVIAEQNKDKRRGNTAAFKLGFMPK